MFKKLPLLSFVFFMGLVSYAQTIVSTTPQNRNVILEEFTGINCVYCPDGHAIAQAIQNANPDRVSLINIHTGSFANPSGSQPDFRTPWGAAIASQGGVTGYPAGQVNRHVFPGRSMTSGKTAMGRGSWTVSANEILAMPSYVNVGVEAVIDVQTRVLTVHVEAYYTGDSPESTNRLNVALLQNNTRGPQTGGGQGNNYNHMYRLVDLLTGQWGETINQTTQGTFVDRTFTYTIPADYRNVEAVLEDMEIVAFVAEGQEEIISGNRTLPDYTGVGIANDIGIEEIKEINPVCLDELGPKVVIKNYGENTLNSLNITYKINGETFTHNWTGELKTFRSEEVELPAVPFNLQENNTLEVLLPNDDNNSNNTASTSFNKAVEGSGTLKLEITTDAWAYEFRWELRDSNYEVIESGRGYRSNTPYYIDMTVPEGCYYFIAYDTAGDGGTRVRLRDHNGVILVNLSGNWGGLKESQFGSDGVLSINQSSLEKINIYPNPAQDQVFISNAENASIQIFDVLGKVVLSQKISTATQAIDVSRLQTGSYFIKIDLDGTTTTKKLMVTK